MNSSNKQMKWMLAAFLLIGCSISSYAQFTLDAQFKPRFEYRHGFGTLFPDDTEPAGFVSQRTRLNAGFKKEKYELYVSVQDVRVWGDVGQLNRADNNGLGLHQAWASLLFSENSFLRVGRQEIAYDDERIMGAVDWAQQARSHDAVRLSYHKNSFTLDVGAAFNQEAENVNGNTYTIPNNYKSMQYAWLNKKWDAFAASFLLLNNGLQFIDPITSDTDTRFSQTLGTHLKFNTSKLSANANVYYQTGSDKADNDLSAYLLGVDLSYKVADKAHVGIGAELQSGNEYGAPSDGENKAFTPLYGTNHKFNGFMDYFYVGNHANNVGLMDLYLKGGLKVNDKSSFSAAVHNFSAAEKLNDDVSKNLGVEVDLGFAHNFSKDMNLNVGYSHLFASEGMEVLKGNSDGNTNNWFWVQLNIAPTLFTSK